MKDYFNRKPGEPMARYFIPFPTEPWHAWIITKDYTPAVFGTRFKDIIKYRTGEFGFEDSGLSAKDIRNHPQGKPFRVVDLDGDLRSEGILVINLAELPGTTQDGDEPFFTICHGFQRIIEIYDNRVWHRYEYMGFKENEWNPYDY
jgi:hypothetical protein